MIRRMSQFPPVEPPDAMNPQDFAPIGTPVGPGTPLPYKPRTNAWALTSLISGVLGCVPFVTGIVAVIAGIVGLKKANDPRYGGRGLAIGGLVLGLLSVLFWTFFGSVFVGIFTATGEPRRLAQDFVKMTSEGATDAALTHAAQNIDRPQLASLARRMEGWGQFEDLTSYSSSINAQGGMTVCELKGTAYFTGGDHPFEMTLIKQDGTWKISALEFD